MSKLKHTLLYSVLLSALAVMPVSAFTGDNGNGNDKGRYNDNDRKTEQRLNEEQYPRAEQTASRFRFGVYYGRPYYYRPYYYNYPYRPYYYRYNYYNRPYYYW